MKKLTLFVITLFFLIVSCNNSSRKSYNSIDFGVFTITVPFHWTKLNNLKGIDSYVGGIDMSHGDTMLFDYGIYSNTFEESVIIVPESDRLALDSAGIHDVIYSDDYENDHHQATYLKQYYFYDTIDGYRVKYMIPKKIGDGNIGISFTGLKNDNRLTIYSSSLDTTAHFDFLKAVKTIKIQKDSE